MNTHIEINPTKLSILSIPRDKSWIFTNSLLLLLYTEHEKSEGNTFSTNGDDSSESDIESPDDQSTLSAHAKHLSVSDYLYSGSSTTSVDNSSKHHSQAANVTSSSSSSTSLSSSGEDSPEKENWFFHIAYTPHECTIVCEQQAMARFFSDARILCQTLGYDDVKLLPGQFLSLQIDSDGYDRSRRIVSLTKPLSDHGISLFFLLTHYSDIVLIPYEVRDRAIEILKNDTTISGDLYSFNVKSDPENVSDISNGSHHEIPDALESTQVLRSAVVRPVIHRKTKLLLTGARLGATSSTLLIAARVLGRLSCIPPYFAITRTAASEVSFLLPSSSKTRRALGFGPMDILGSEMDVIVPITIDLNLLPLDSTGIVAGLATKLVDVVSEDPGDQSLFEMSYLSMARSGMVLIPRENINVISKVLDRLDFTI